MEREVWSSNLGLVRSNTELPTARHPLRYFFERSCVVRAQWRGDGSANSLHASALHSEYTKTFDLICCWKVIRILDNWLLGSSWNAFITVWNLRKIFKQKYCTNRVEFICVNILGLQNSNTLLRNDNSLFVLLYQCKNTTSSILQFF